MLSVVTTMKTSSSAFAVSLWQGKYPSK